MKIIFSRKGTDSVAGKFPSPIVPNGNLLSIPIPSSGHNTYADIFYNGKSYSDIIKELRTQRCRIDYSKETCHLDPDLVKGSSKDWKPAFGQCDENSTAQSYLKNRNIGKDDIFLFFGWFKKTKNANGVLRFVPNTDIHIIWGYLQIGEILTDQKKINQNYHWHPHANVNWKNNCLYIPREILSLDKSKPGYGTFKYDGKRILTKENSKRSDWKSLAFFENFNHNSGHRQEKVFDCDNEAAMRWIKNIFD